MPLAVMVLGSLHEPGRPPPLGLDLVPERRPRRHVSALLLCLVVRRWRLGLRGSGR